MMVSVVKTAMPATGHGRRVMLRDAIPQRLPLVVANHLNQKISLSSHSVKTNVNQVAPSATSRGRKTTQKCSSPRKPSADAVTMLITSGVIESKSSDYADA